MVANKEALVLRSPTLDDFFKAEHLESFLHFLVGYETGNCIRAEYILPFVTGKRLADYTSDDFIAYQKRIESVLPGGLRIIGLVTNEDKDSINCAKIINQLKAVDPASSLVSNNRVTVVIRGPEDISVSAIGEVKVVLGEGFDPKAPAIKQFKAVTTVYDVDVEAIVESRDLEHTMKTLNTFTFHIDDDKGKVYVINGSDGPVGQGHYIHYNGRIVIRELPYMDDDYKQQCIREGVARALIKVSPKSTSYQVDMLTNRFLPPLVFYGTPDVKSVGDKLIEVVQTLTAPVKIRNLTDNSSSKVDFTSLNKDSLLKDEYKLLIAMAVFIGVAAVITSYFLLG